MPETKDLTWIEQHLKGLKSCIGVYQEFRLLPITWRLGLNFLNCYWSFIDWILFGKEIESWCKFNEDNHIYSEKLVYWEGYRMTLPVMQVCV